MIVTRKLSCDIGEAIRFCTISNLSHWDPCKYLQFRGFIVFEHYERSWLMIWSPLACSDSPYDGTIKISNHSIVAFVYITGSATFSHRVFRDQQSNLTRSKVRSWTFVICILISVMMYITLGVLCIRSIPKDNFGVLVKFVLIMSALFCAPIILPITGLLERFRLRVMVNFRLACCEKSLLVNCW